MNAPYANEAALAATTEFTARLASQREAYLADPVPSYTQRVADLQALHRMIKDNQDAIVKAISADYGNRSEFESLFAEIFVVLGDIKSTIKHLKKWMKPQRRHVDFMLYPTSKNRVIPQPLGVIGIIVPWNFPINLSMAPLAGAFAAGNRAMIKMSENSNHLAELLANLSPKYFPLDKVQVFPGGTGKGAAFSALPFDHLIFTGSGPTGSAVMAAAARNLTPVTLELGGKCPAIVGPDFPIATAADRIMWVKGFNAGQICTNVDFCFLPEGTEQAFEEEAKRLIAKRYPDINSPDYTSIIDEKSHRRMQHTLDDAIAKGARAVNLFPGQEADPALHKFPLTLLFNVTDDMDVMQREIFGPLLPIKTYQSKEEVLEYINRRDRPLAIYPFTNDRDLQDFYINRTMSGGVTVNNALLHVGQHDMPFGGVGASGMGHYHGYEGFVTFSKLRPIHYQGPFSAMKFFMPPYANHPIKMLKAMVKFLG